LTVPLQAQVEALQQSERNVHAVTGAALVKSPAKHRASIRAEQDLADLLDELERTHRTKRTPASTRIVKKTASTTTTEP
jgi:hypothetical protein